MTEVTSKSKSAYCECGARLCYKFHEIGKCAKCQQKFTGAYKYARLVERIKLGLTDNENYKKYHSEYYFKNKNRLQEQARARYQRKKLAMMPSPVVEEIQ